MGNNNKPPIELEFLAEESTNELNETAGEETIMEYVKKTHDFKSISEKNLQDLFSILQKRCPETWNPQLETRARDFYEKIKILRKENLSRYMDPMKYASKKSRKSSHSHNKKITAADLITTPALWEMQKKERGVELYELLRHFTIYAAFEGRPFIREWFEALVPCFSRWLLQSDSGDKAVLWTLKHFLGAFGQPAIVVCLSDKGSSILKTLQDSARSVESVGRGTVERYYWKRLAESSCGGEKEWRELASIKDKPLELSQLDTLPANWLLDVGDWVQLFANIVSPRITTRFGERIHEIVHVDDVKADIQLGPSKSLERSFSKSKEYKKDFESQSVTRWSRFGKKFRDTFGRPPKKPEDFVLNIVDFARCSIIVQSARELLKVKKLIEKEFKVVGVKNGYSSKVEAKGSGYRDFKMLIQVEFDNLKLGNVPKVEQKLTMICEVQLICAEWLKNKKTTSLSYKVIRSSNLRELLRDFSKYLQPGCKDDGAFKVNASDVLKNGWKNVARYTDFSEVDKDELLIESVSNGCNTAGVEILINQLGADPNAKDRIGFTAACTASRWGHASSLKTLIELKCDVEAADNTGWTPLKHAARWNREECVRVLLANGCSLNEKQLESFVERYGKWKNYERVTILLRGQHLPPSKPKKRKRVTMLDEAVTAAVEERLENFFDTHDVPLSVASELLSTEVIAKRIEHSLQLLWFGADVNGRGSLPAPLYFAISHGTYESVKILLDSRANVNIKLDRGRVPRPAGLKDMEKVVQALLEVKAGIENCEDQDDEWTPIHCALRCAKNRKEIIARHKKARRELEHERLLWN